MLPPLFDWPAFYADFLKFFFLFTPFFALSMFLCLTADYDEGRRRRLAWRIARSAFLICAILLFFGRGIFLVFGITLDAFRAGVGTVLLLNGIGLVKGRKPEASATANEDVATVPMAIPVIAGPATIGAIVVMGSGLETVAQRVTSLLAIAAASAAIGLLLCLSTRIERALGRRGIEILSKITGLILASLAAQMILAGVAGFLKP